MAENAEHRNYEDGLQAGQIQALHDRMSTLEKSVMSNFGLLHRDMTRLNETVYTLKGSARAWSGIVAIIVSVIVSILIAPWKR